MRINEKEFLICLTMRTKGTTYYKNVNAYPIKNADQIPAYIKSKPLPKFVFIYPKKG